MEPNLPTCDLITALTDDKYANYQYEMDRIEGALYLSDGVKKIVKVDLMNKFSQIRSEFFDKISDNPNNISLSGKIKNLINSSFEKNDNNFNNFGAINVYCNAYGIPEIKFTKEDLPNFLKRSETLFEVLGLCYGNISNTEITKIVAQTLDQQEIAILKKIPEKAFGHPDALHAVLSGMLKEKGLTYEMAVAQFDWSKAKPLEKAAEGSYVLAKLIAQVDAWEAIRSKKGGENFPFHDVWRFCIDESREQFGAYIFENEAFYILSSLRGLKEIIESKKHPNRDVYEGYAASLTLNPPIIKHQSIFTSKTFTPVDSHFFGCKMTNKEAHFDASFFKKDPIGEEDIIKRGNAQIEAEKRIKLPDAQVTDEDYWIANATGFHKTDTDIWAVTNTSSNIIAQRIFLGFENLLEKAKNPGESLMAYIWAARELEVSHQLEDGNGRTSIAFLINRIMNDSELPPYIPQDPNILDQQGPEALLRDVHQGMLHFVELSQGNPESIISVETLVDQAGVRGQSWDVVHQRAELAKEQIHDLIETDKRRDESIPRYIITSITNYVTALMRSWGA